MRYKAWVVLLSTSAAFILMTSAYGFWEKELVIKTDIDVVAPPPQAAAVEAGVFDGTAPVAGEVPITDTITGDAASLPESTASTPEGTEQENSDGNSIIEPAVPEQAGPLEAVADAAVEEESLGTVSEANGTDIAADSVVEQDISDNDSDLETDRQAADTTADTTADERNDINAAVAEESKADDAMAGVEIQDNSKDTMSGSIENADIGENPQK